MTTEYIDMTKVSNEATLIVEDGALKTVSTVSTPSGSLSVDITTNPVPISGAITIATNPVPISETWRAALTQDESVGSNKLFTVPAATEWQILSIWAELTSDGVSGNRQLDIQILDSENDVIASLRTSTTQASGITRYYLLAPGLPDLLSFRDTDSLMTPIPPTFILTAGEKIRVWDNKVISSGVDTLNVQIKYAYRTV